VTHFEEKFIFYCNISFSGHGPKLTKKQLACPWRIAYLKLPTKSSDSFITKPEKKHRSIVGYVLYRADYQLPQQLVIILYLKELAGRVKKIKIALNDWSVTCTKYVVRIFKVDVHILYQLMTFI
jgi:hypothetical protein